MAYLVSGSMPLNMNTESNLRALQYPERFPHPQEHEIVERPQQQAADVHALWQARHMLGEQPHLRTASRSHSRISGSASSANESRHTIRTRLELAYIQYWVALNAGRNLLGKAINHQKYE